MAPHALDQLWRFNDPTSTQSQTKKPGKPALQWTPSRERKLFRHVAIANVPMKDIAKVMYEPAKDGQPEFKPCNSSCRNHWHEITELWPTETHIDNDPSKEKQKGKMVAAFKEYQERQSKAQPSPESQLPSNIPGISNISVKYSTSTISPEIGATSDVSTPLLTFEGETPADLGPQIPTPDSHTIEPDVASGDPQQLDGWGRAPDEIEMSRIPPPAHITATKRRVPTDFDEVAESSNQKILKQHSVPSITNKLFRVRTLSGQLLNPVQEDPDEYSEPQSSIFEIEDEMHVPRGFIPWVSSVISASGTAVSRLSSRRSSQRRSVDTEAPEDPVFGHKRVSSSAHFQHVLGEDLDIFLELRRNSATDQDVAARIQHYLKHLSPARARQVVNARNDLRETAIEIALGIGNRPAIDVLLDFGADLKAKTSDGKSLAAFGRAAEKRDIPSKYYYAIGICRNRIFSREGEQSMKNNPQIQNVKRTASVNDSVRLKTKSRVRNTTFPRRANTTHAPPPLSRGLARLGSLVSISQDQLRRSKSNASRQSNKSSYSRPVSLQQAPSLPFSDSLWNRLSGQQETPIAQLDHISQDVLPNTQPVDPNLIAQEETLGSILPNLDVNLGSWELLPDNRIVFVPHSQNNIGTSIIPNAPWSSNNAPEAELSDTTIGLAQFPDPPARIEFRQPNQRNSLNTRRHGMILDPVVATSLGVEASDTLPEDIFQEYLQPSVIPAIMNSQTHATIAFRNAYDEESNNNMIHGWGVQPHFEAPFQPHSTRDEAPTFMDVTEEELDDLFAGESSNNKHPSGWI